MSVSLRLSPPETTQTLVVHEADEHRLLFRRARSIPSPRILVQILPSADLSLLTGESRRYLLRQWEIGRIQVTRKIRFLCQATPSRPSLRQTHTLLDYRDQGKDQLRVRGIPLT